MINCFNWINNYEPGKIAILFQLLITQYLTIDDIEKLLLLNLLMNNYEPSKMVTLVIIFNILQSDNRPIWYRVASNEFVN